jgi:hypothetical protein
MTAFFDTAGDLWVPVAGERPDNVPSDMMQLLTFVRTDVMPSGAAEQPAIYLNLTRYTRMIVLSCGCPT